MTSKRRVDRRSQNPELRNIDHDKHNEARLPDGRTTASGTTRLALCRFRWSFTDVKVMGRIGLDLLAHPVAFLPTAQTVPSRISISITSSGRGGGPYNTLPVAASNAPS